MSWVTIDRTVELSELVPIERLPSGLKVSHRSFLGLGISVPAAFAKMTHWTARNLLAAIQTTQTYVRQYSQYVRARNRIYQQTWEYFPEFPWPPESSATVVLPSAFLAKAVRRHLENVDQILASALAACGYYDRSYYAVPSGFALATRLEQINP